MGRPQAIEAQANQATDFGGHSQAHSHTLFPACEGHEQTPDLSEQFSRTPLGTRRGCLLGDDFKKALRASSSPEAAFLILLMYGFLPSRTGARVSQPEKKNERQHRDGQYGPTQHR